MSLELHLAWQAAGRDPKRLVQVARGLFRVDGASLADDELDNTGTTSSDARHGSIMSRAMPCPVMFDSSCVAHLAGQRRRLRLLLKPESSEGELVAQAAKADLKFLHGFSLDEEGPCPVRYESTAPYIARSAFLTAALSRSIEGPLLQCTEDSDTAVGRWLF